MFAHIFLYRLKCLLRDKETIFWTMLFPILLAVFFNLALSNVYSDELFQPISIAVVDDADYQNNTFFQAAVNEASQGENRLFDLQVTTMDEADRLLKSNAIAGYIIVENPLRLVVANSGLRQSIIKSYLDSYQQTVSAVNKILSADPARHQEVLNSIGDRRQFVREVSGTGSEPDTVLNYFYTLIAMACFYGSFFGMREVTDIQADISPLAARINAAPVHKLKAFIYSLSSSLLIHITEMLILLVFLRFIIRVDFGSDTGFVLLTTLLGSIAGVSFGALISALVKKSEGIKVAILIGASMTGSFLSGMMYLDMKYIIARKLPLLSYLNPVNLLTDAFYSLYYYDTYTRYALNMRILSVFVVLFCGATYFIVRRRKYASL